LAGPKVPAGPDHVMTSKRKHDIAYGCFFVPAALSLIAVTADAVPMNDANAALIGFFVMIPLTVVALVTTLIGVFYSILLWRDGVLPILSLLTIIMITVVFSDAGKIELCGLIYGILVLVLEGSWFLKRRRIRFMSVCAMATLLWVGCASTRDPLEGWRVCEQPVSRSDA